MKVKLAASRRTTFLCDATGPLVVPDQDCPNAADHTPHPTGYIAHAMWADSMLEAGNVPTMCPGACGKFNVWTGPDGSGLAPVVDV